MRTSAPLILSRRKSCIRPTPSSTTARSLIGEPMVDRLTGKIAIVTGAGQGIGAAIAAVFAREGAAVVVAERNRETGSAIAEAIAAQGAPSLFVETDISDRVSVEAMVAQAAASFGKIDILINNAGVNVFHEPLETTDEEWRRCLAVDLEGAWIVSRAVLPSMRARSGGAIVNIASSHSFSIIPNTFPYPVAKHGLLGLTRALGDSICGRGHSRKRHCAGLYRNADRPGLLGHFPRSRKGTAARLRSPSAQAHRHTGRSRDDRALPGVR